MPEEKNKKYQLLEELILLCNDQYEEPYKLPYLNEFFLPKCRFCGHDIKKDHKRSCPVEKYKTIMEKHDRREKIHN